MQPVWPSNYNYAEQWAGPNADACVNLMDNSMLNIIRFGEPTGPNALNEITLNQLVQACPGPYSGMWNASSTYLSFCDQRV